MNITKNVHVPLQKRLNQFCVLDRLREYKERLKKYNHFDLRKIFIYEKHWKYLKQKYRKIDLYGIEMVSIGETIPRLFNMLEDVNKKDLSVVLPTFFPYYIGGIYNWRLLDVFRKRFYFIRENNIDFWTYVLCTHIKDINIEEFDKYRDVRIAPTKVTLGRPLLPFSPKEILEGENKIKGMGIQGEFVCLHARENNVKRECFGKWAAYDTKCRDCDINTFIKTSRYLDSLGVQSVRMGKYESKKCRDDKIIDYANKYYDEFMDFYLLYRCKFLVSSNTGISTICGFWGKPVLVTNMIHLCYGGESLPDTGFNMYIPKKFYSKSLKRYLNLYETLDVMDECTIYTSRFVRKGILLEDNTEDEILEATIEFNRRLEGKWVESEKEKEDYELYWKIINCWRKRHKYIKAKLDKPYTMFFYKLCYSFLKSNVYLLDVDKSVLNKDFCEGRV